VPGRVFTETERTRLDAFPSEIKPAIFAVGLDSRTKSSFKVTRLSKKSNIASSLCFPSMIA
jgi:hypothetical protein